jgi:hypothetical protein
MRTALHFELVVLPTRAVTGSNPEHASSLLLNSSPTYMWGVFAIDICSIYFRPELLRVLAANECPLR